MVRARPSWAICATFVASGLVSVALVATTPMVVLAPPWGPFDAPSRSSRRASASPCPLAVRTPARTDCVVGSMMSPTALTATMAATVSPLSRVPAAAPSPPFMARAMPRSSPPVAPAPAPTLPSADVSLLAWVAAR